MSWYKGNQPAKTVESSWPQAAWMTISLWMRLAWVTITPLGLPVDPEVYWRNASEEASGDSTWKASASDVGTVSVQTQVAPPVSGDVPSVRPAALRVTLLESTRHAPESWRMPSSRGSSRELRSGATGTATTRAKKQAMMASMKSRPGW